MEFKDEQYGGKFDWLDIAAGEIGGVIGQAITNNSHIFICITQILISIKKGGYFTFIFGKR